MAHIQQGITLKALLENPNLINPPKPNSDAKQKKDDFSDLDSIFSGMSAFLGPNIWGKSDTLPYNAADLQLEYMDLDEFLNETGMTKEEQAAKVPSGCGQPRIPQVDTTLQWSPPKGDQQVLSPQADSRLSPGFVSPHASPRPSPAETGDNVLPNPACIQTTPAIQTDKVSFQVTHQDLALATIPGQDEFNPAQAKFSEEDLKPQPMIKKSKKVFIPEDMKDDRYWNRRKKNNVAAKRSRDARRIKENQIAMRAAYLETENLQMKLDLAQIKEENEKLKAENDKLQAKLAKYEANSTFG